MATSNTSMSRRGRPVSVEVGVSPKKAPVIESPPDMCIVGIANRDDPRLALALPRCLVTESRFQDEEDTTVEHVRIISREALPYLPSLRSSKPSRIRDAVRLALGAGARRIDIVLVRGEGLSPWDLDDARFVFAVDPFVSNMLGTAMVYPDIGGPVSCGPGTAVDPEVRVQRFVRTVKAHKTRWVERYQIGMLDVPDVDEALTQRVLTAAASTDSTLCRWQGEPRQRARHGWRSAAAFVAGVLASRPGDIIGGFAGTRVALDGGRQVEFSRTSELTLADTWRAEVPDDTYFVDVVAEAGDIGFIRSEPTLRAPVGSWSIPAIRVAKVIHWQILRAASAFVFEGAEVTRAMALAATVKRALEPYSRAGVLSGPDGDPAPLVRGGVVRDRAAPGLRVEIGAQLRPWSHSVAVRVNLRQGSTPVLEEVA